MNPSVWSHGRGGGSCCGTREARRRAGDLCPIEALDREGLAVTSQGALVRVLRAAPKPLVMSTLEREQVGHALGQLAGRLPAGQSLQFYVEATPVGLDALLERSETDAPGDPGARLRRATRPRRCGACTAMRGSMERHADEQAAVELAYYVIVPFLPDQQPQVDWRRLLRGGRGRLGTAAPLERSLAAHRRVARESLHLTDAIRADLEALDLSTHLLDGSEVLDLLWRRFNPTCRSHAGPPTGGARAAFGDPRRAGRHGGRTGFGPGRAGAARAGRCVGDRLARPAPPAGRPRPGAGALCRHAAGCDRVRVAAGACRSHARSRFPCTCTRLTGCAALALQEPPSPAVRGQPRRRAARAHAGLRDAHPGRPSSASCSPSSPGTSARRRLRSRSTSRSRGRPRPRSVALARSSRARLPGITAASDARSLGQLRQLELWQSTLPLGRGRPAHAHLPQPPRRRPAVPLVGTGCGSPTGIPFAFTDPSRGSLIDPFDRHDGTLLVNARSGGGKTFLVNVLIARLLAHGIEAFVLDRAGHYAFLCALVPDAGLHDRRLHRRAPSTRGTSTTPPTRWRRSPTSSPCTRSSSATTRPTRTPTASTRSSATCSRSPSTPTTPVPPVNASCRGSGCSSRSCAAEPSGRASAGAETLPLCCARWPSSSRRSWTRAPTPTCSTAKRPCRDAPAGRLRHAQGSARAFRRGVVCAR